MVLTEAIPLVDIQQEQARRHHLRFMQHCWRKLTPLYIGPHTSWICERIDEAIERYRNGESSFLIIKVPFRHGKSDIVSRYLPPHLLGLFPDNEILLASYGADLSHGFSRNCRELIRTEKYQELFPGIKVDQDASAVSHWEIAGHMGCMNSVGFGGTMVGRGYEFGIVDEIHKNRQEAESATIRERNWESFTNDFLTRRGPVSMTLLLTTPWHVDDIIGRAEKAMVEVPDFPQFEVISFPAFSDEYESGYLFPERFNESWYLTQAAALGTYGTASLLQCDPVARSGNLLKTDKVKIHELADVPPALRWGRGWDLASTEKQLVKEDPDYTVGLELAIQWRLPPEESGITEKIPHLWIKDVIRGRWAAPERDRRIKQTAMIDGAAVVVGTESVGGYKDTYEHMAEILKGLRSVRKITPPGDLLVRVAPLEPIFEAGNVHLVRGEWNRDFLKEVGDYPSGAHDDQAAGLVTAWEMLKANPAPMGRQVSKRKPMTAGLRGAKF